MKQLYLLLGLTLLGAWSSLAFFREEEWRDKVDPKVFLRLEEQDEVEFLVFLKAQADVSKARNYKTKEERGRYVFNALRQQAEQSQRPIRQLLDAGGYDYQSYFIVNSLLVKGDREVLKTLAERPEVKNIQDNTEFKVPELLTSDDLQTRGPDAIEWGIQMIRADLVWDLGITGQGVIVGGQDTGYDWQHPALKSKYKGFDGSSADHNYTWHDAIHEINPLNNDSTISASNNPCGLDSPFPCDDHNHGTHTMGTMVGSDGDNQIGVAPGARWIACRNMERGYGSPSSYIECFEWFMAPTDLANQNPDPAKAPHVIANSWSCPELEGCNPANFSLMQAAVDNLKASGVVVVVSAGNSGSQGCESVSTPAAIFESSFTVGASAENDTITGFSSRGPVSVDNSFRTKPNVVAPGRNVRSCIRNGEYATYNGTSMAGPHVAGAVALIIAANPALAGQVEVIETILEQTAVPKQTDQDCGTIPGTDVPNNTYGYGRIDVLAAEEEALALDSTNSPGIIDPRVAVYPNPFNKSMVLRFTNWYGNTKLELFDAAGRLVHLEEWEAQNERLRILDLSDLPGGIYFYRIDNGENSHNGKVIKRYA
ncbi:MAG: S8 family peptidase [Phaeodactylibacter sp.]|nr:S8 family peptidase [Phaeodactylibacter sp.]